MTRRVCAFCVLAVLLSAGVAATQGFPHESVQFECETCHVSAEDRLEIGFDHAETDLALEGRHASLGCRRCHDVADFSRVAARCAGCHTDYHAAQLYPDCERCHTPSGWTVFDHHEVHSGTSFQLMGTHVRLDCDACHRREIVSEYAWVTSECVGCHVSDFEGAVEPPHDEAGFGSDCTKCHSMLAWAPAFYYEHAAYFPIYSGNHAGEWGGCSDCHTAPGDYQTFSCLDCHRHQQPAMDATHAGVPGYSYDSQSCLGCHPDGRASSLSEDHDARFPIYSGDHAGEWNSCSDCHVNPSDYGDFSCLECHEHDQADMADEHSGVGGYEYDSQACLACHPRGK
ncbi:MAG: hypothetical protein ABIG03_05725 [Candidatus Eisenbacteria bacterium]